MTAMDLLKESVLINPAYRLCAWRAVLLNWDDFALQRHLALTGDTLDCHNYVLLTSQGGSLCRMFCSILQYTAQTPQQRIIWSSNAEVEEPHFRNVTAERVSIRWKKRPPVCKILRIQ